MFTYSFMTTTGSKINLVYFSKYIIFPAPLFWKRGFYQYTGRSAQCMRGFKLMKAFIDTCFLIWRLWRRFSLPRGLFILKVRVSRTEPVFRDRSLSKTGSFEKYNFHIWRNIYLYVLRQGRLLRFFGFVFLFFLFLLSYRYFHSAHDEMCRNSSSSKTSLSWAVDLSVVIRST